MFTCFQDTLGGECLFSTASQQHDITDSVKFVSIYQHFINCCVFCPVLHPLILMPKVWLHFPIFHLLPSVQVLIWVFTIIASCSKFENHERWPQNLTLYDSIINHLWMFRWVLPTATAPTLSTLLWTTQASQVWGPDKIRVSKGWWLRRTVSTPPWSSPPNTPGTGYYFQSLSNSSEKSSGWH